MESLSTKLSDRRKNKRFGKGGKRLSILAPGSRNSISDPSHPSQAHNGDHDHNDEDNFAEIFKVLDELEGGNHIFGDITPTVETIEETKEEVIREIKKTYEDRIKELEAQPENPVTKIMLKSVKEDMEQAINEAKERILSQN